MIQGHLYTEGIVKSDYPDQIKAQIAALPSDCEVIIHHIKSPGGDVYAAWKAIPELMKIGKPVKAIVEGEASSIASWLMVAGTSEVEATDPSTFMIHEPFFPPGVLTDAMGVDDLGGAKIELEQIRQSMAEAYAKKTKRPVEEMLAMMKNKTRLNAQMAKSMGLVDKVIANEPFRIAAMVEEFGKDFKAFKQEIMGLFKSRVVAVTAVDLPAKDGKVVKVETENGDLVGKPASIDGQPCTGEVALADGRVLLCENGMVKEVKTAAPQETAEQALQRRITEMQSQLQALEADKVKAEAEKKAAAEKIAAETATKALEEEKLKVAALAKELEEAKNKTVGPDGKPNEGTIPNRTPSAMDKKIDAGVRASRSFIAEHMPWLERHYKGGKFEDGTDFNSYRNGGPNAVSILETNLNYTWNGILDTELFFKPTLGSPALSELANIDLGASHLKRYHIAPNADKILKPYTGCDQAVTGTALDITSKFIQIKPFRMKEKWCKDDFTNQLSGSYNELAQNWLKTGNASFDPAGTPVERIVMNLLKDSLRRDVFRRVSFGDTTSSNADYNQIDGYWQSLIDQSGASNYCVYRYGSALGTGTLSANTASAYFEGIFNNSSLLLKQEGVDMGKAKFLVTRSVWENYYTTLVGVGAVTEAAYADYKNGVKNLTFRGIPVIPVTLWDSFLADSNNPLSSTTRHLISFTTTDNHIIGVENTGDLQAIKSWFSDDDNVRYYSAQMSFGFLGAIHCELSTISY